VVDSAIEVHRHLGPGYAENVYEDALCVEFQLRGISFARHFPIQLTYKGSAIGSGRLDLLVGKALIVELKTVEAILPIHSAQVISYLKMTGLSLGLLLNFKTPLMKDGIRRIVNSPSALASLRLGGGISKDSHGK
jgi:GxxExxY protein